jgi:RNA polymerase sigma-70 factor (ECF subfamily)
MGELESWPLGTILMPAERDDRAAFERELRPLLLPGYRLAYAMLQDRSAAEDAVQEAALKAWRRLGNLRDGNPMGPWFYGIVANQCRTVKRQRWWSVLRSGEPLDRRGDAMDVDRVEDDLDLKRTVAGLPADQREVVLLHYFMDLPLEQVAVAIDVPLGTVKSRLHRALVQLRPIVDKETDS